MGSKQLQLFDATDPYFGLTDAESADLTLAYEQLEYADDFGTPPGEQENGQALVTPFV